jgi:hypothetical protein
MQPIADEYKIFSGATVTATQEIDMLGCKTLILIVVITGSPGTGGYAQAVVIPCSGGAEIAHPAATNEKSTVQTANYMTIYSICPPYMKIKLTITDGIFDVYAVRLP